LCFFYQYELGLYFLDFLSLEQMKGYTFVCKTSSAVFKKSVYYRELSSFRELFPDILYNKHLKICEGGYLNLWKCYLRDMGFIDYGCLVLYAADYNHLEIIKYLVTLGAVLRAENDSSLSIASEKGHLEIVKYLVSMGADIRGNIGNAVQRACAKGHLETVKYLVSLAADIRANNDPAIIWAYEGVEGDHMESVKYLVFVGADNDYTIRSSSRNYKIPGLFG